MVNCSEQFNYPPQEEDRLRFTRLSIPAMNMFSMLVNAFASIFILLHSPLRQQNLGTLKLFIFNSGECLVTSYELMYNGLSKLVQRNYFANVITFFLVGQSMAISLVTIERIQMVTGSFTSVNNVTRNPTREKYPVRLIFCIFGAVTLNALLSALIPYPQYVVAITVLFNTALYTILVIKVAKLRSRVHGAVDDVRKKTLMYVSALFVGFMSEYAVFFIQGALVREQFIKGCPPVLTVGLLLVMYLLNLKFVWEPLTYFAFNARPRSLLIDAFQIIRVKFTCCHTVERSERGDSSVQGQHPGRDPADLNAPAPGTFKEENANSVAVISC